MMARRETFEAFLRERRLERGVGLRAFAKRIGMQPSNYCSIESGSLPAPSTDKLQTIARELELEGEERRRLFDLAAESKDDIPADLKELVRRDAVIPALLRTVEDMDIGPEQILQIVEDIKSGRYRKSSA
jgi:transcriptional regulator with XRE-family HTH domain